MEAFKASDRYYFPTNFKVLYFLYRAALKFSSTLPPSFTEVAAGASETLGGSEPGN